jgi:hypothetical protein
MSAEDAAIERDLEELQRDGGLPEQLDGSRTLRHGVPLPEPAGVRRLRHAPEFTCP